MISIRAKLLLFMSVVVVFVDLVSCLLFLIHHKRELEEDLKKFGMSLVMLLANDSEARHAIMYSQSSFLDIPLKRIYAFDKKGELGYWRIANTHSVIREGKAPWLNLEMKEIPNTYDNTKSKIPYLDYISTAAGEVFYDFSTPVFEKDFSSQEVFAARILSEDEDVVDAEIKHQKVGFVQIGLSTRKIREEWYNTIWYGVIPLGLGVVFGWISIAFLITKYIVSPLRDLTRVTQNIAKGDLNHMVDIHSNDEIGQLSMHFNKMTESLKTSYEELKREMMNHKLTSEQLRKLSQAVEQSPAAVVITDTKGNIEYINQKFSQLTGYTAGEAIGQNLRFFKSDETPPEEYNRLWNIIMTGQEWYGELHNKKKDGELYWEQTSISSIKNSEGTITHFLAIKEDITERKNIEMQLVCMADNDPLTNLFNRRRFRKELEHWVALAQRYGVNGALLFLDMDNFKYINDTLGHLVGDEILIRFADLLRERMREGDILARLGGDEFAIILPYTGESEAQLIAQEILKLVRNRIDENEKTKHLIITVSVGIVLFPEHGNDTEALLTYADLAMYKAKEEGRNRITVFSPDQKMQIELRLEWEKRIRDALVHDRFALHLQPISDIRQNKIFGYEALLRMIDEKGEVIPPAEFLDVAERFGLIHEIDSWVVCRAIRMLIEHQFDRKGLFLEVNLSGMAFKDPQLLSLIKREFTATMINPKSLIFEITETAIIENMIAAQRFITSLKAIGSRFALDDFGIGFSSFNYLKHLPVDYLKIDGAFIRDLTHNTVDQHLVKAIVEVARGLGKLTVAEFVGCKETVQLLSEYGVDYAQGYFIGYPGKVAEV